MFLDAVQKGLEGEQPLLGLMFADNVGDSFSVSSPHTGLLWALENVAWSPEHFSLAVEQLARLAEVDPGGPAEQPRPAASLADIYRSWLPQTSVPLDRRLAALDGLRVRHPTVSWSLLLTMLPESNAAGSFSHSPRYRDWRPPETGTYDVERYSPSQQRNPVWSPMRTWIRTGGLGALGQPRRPSCVRVRRSRRRS